MAELENYWPLLRPGGLLAGHDYCSQGEVQNSATLPRQERISKALAKVGQHEKDGHSALNFTYKVR